MKGNKRIEYVTRDRILKLLTDDDISRVTMAETAECLSDGDEYVDLEELDQGVRRALGATTPMGNVLPRKAVHENTWHDILAVLAAPRMVAARSRA